MGMMGKEKTDWGKREIDKYGVYYDSVGKRSGNSHGRFIFGLLTLSDF